MPNIDGKDLELLSKLAGTSRQDFNETVPTGNPIEQINTVILSIDAKNEVEVVQADRSSKE